ncbi:ESX-1 secretion-associated protein EspB [Mycobacterium kansasii 824]|nr:ESX-1 secretion-associated protein EspB [Mycobacterium kansasii 824]
MPNPPCALTAAKNAAQQLALSAENMREFLAAGAKERQKLATSLRNAAKAYGEVDSESATALNSDGSGTVEAQSAGGAGGDSSAGLQDTPTVAAAGDPDFTDLKTAAVKLESGDQGRSLVDFANAWNDYNFALQGDVKRFRAFDNWEGDAATACEASLDQQREWILHMAKLSAALAKQAQYIAQLQVWAIRSHPSSADIAKLEELSKDPAYKDQAIKLYAEYQQKSEQVLSEYNTKATLEPVNPPKPPAAIKIDPPPPAQPQGLIPSFLMPPSDGSGGTPVTGMPMAPMAPAGGAGGGMPAGTSAELTSAAHQAAANLSKDPGMKPMSLGGGGGGGGIGGAPLGEPAAWRAPTRCGRLPRATSPARLRGRPPRAVGWAGAAWECRWGHTARAREAPSPRAPSKTTRRYTPRTVRGPRPSSVTVVVKTARSRSDQHGNGPACRPDISAGGTVPNGPRWDAQSDEHRIFPGHR